MLTKFEVIRGGGLRVNKFNFANSMQKDHAKLMLRFCNAQEVNSKRKANHVQKTTFLVKMQQLKEKGAKLEQCRKFEIWLDDHFKTLCQDDTQTKQISNLTRTLSVKQLQQ